MAEGGSPSPPCKDIEDDLFTNCIANQRNQAPIYCTPCQKTNNMDTPAKFWCKTIDVVFCDSCKVSLHDILHQGCDAENIDGKDILTPMQKMPAECSSHKNKLDCYCKNHRIHVCTECITMEHMRCEVVTLPDSNSKKTSGNSSLDRTIDNLQTARFAMLLSSAFDEQVRCMQLHKGIGIKSILDRRRKMNAYLDKKQGDIIEEIKTIFDEEKASSGISKQHCIRLSANLLNIQEACQSAGLNDDGVETTLLQHRAKADLASCACLVNDTRKTFKSVKITHEVASGLTDLEETTTLSLGKIVLSKELASLPDGVGRTRALAECRAEKVRTVECSNGEILGIVYLSATRVLVNFVIWYHSNCSLHSLRLYTTEGELVTTYSSEGGGMLAVSGAEYTVVVVKGHDTHAGTVQSGDLQQSEINLPPSYGAITYLDNGIFTVETPPGNDKTTGHIADAADNLHTIRIECTYLALDTKRDYLYASFNNSTVGEVAVTRVSDGIQIDILKVGVVKGAAGISVDDEGNVYVCGQASNNVIQMSEDGTNIREILTSADGIEKPMAISVFGDKMVVANAHAYDVYQLY